MSDLPRPPVASGARELPQPGRPAMAGLSSGALAYYAGGALDERTLTANRDAFARTWLVPRESVGIVRS